VVAALFAGGLPWFARFGFLCGQPLFDKPSAESSNGGKVCAAVLEKITAGRTLQKFGFVLQKSCSRGTNYFKCAA
jgi:hypothetical protein